MQLNPSEISELLKSRIQKLGVDTNVRNQGTVVTVTDGICRVHGLSDAMQGEILEFKDNTFGLALNLERDSVGAVVLGDYEHVSEGDTDFLKITPGATFSMTSRILALIGPLPSIGSPSELTTRPSSSGPTGTSRMRPVVLTVSPSETCS